MMIIFQFSFVYNIWLNTTWLNPFVGLQSGKCMIDSKFCISRLFWEYLGQIYQIWFFKLLTYKEGLMNPSFIKGKNNVGRVLPQQWILGGICRDDNKCFLVQVPKRNARTPMENIQEHVNEGLVIYTDCWNGYKTEESEEAAFNHFIMNHKYNFVNPKTDAHTQKVKCLWGSAK